MHTSEHSQRCHSKILCVSKPWQRQRPRGGSYVVYLGDVVRLQLHGLVQQLADLSDGGRRLLVLLRHNERESV